MAQQAPDPGVEVARHLLQSAQPDPVLQPVPTAWSHLQWIGNFPLHAPADVQLLTALQGGSSVVHVAQKAAQSVADEMG